MERKIAKLDDKQAQIEQAMAEAADDFARVAELNEQLSAVREEKDELDTQWMEVADKL